MKLDYSIHLDFFSGPMDLLLHLVHQKEVTVSEVNMSIICEQYLDIVNNNDFLDLEKASEYLVVASTLISIKSQSLLPSSDKVIDPASDNYSDNDPEFYEELRLKLQKQIHQNLLMQHTS